METGNKQDKTRANQQIDAVLAMAEEIQTRHRTETSKLTELAPLAKFVTNKDIEEVFSPAPDSLNSSQEGEMSKRSQIACAKSV